MSASTNSSNKPNATGASALFSRLAANADVTFAQFLSPLECLTLLYVSKAARRAAVRQLKVFQSDPLVQWKQQTFDAWLGNPTLGAGGDDETNGTIRRMQDEADVNRLCGPVRLDCIADNADEIRNQIVILNYQRTYKTEETLVAVFDDDGWLFQVYKLESQTNYGEPARRKRTTFPGLTDEWFPDDSFLRSPGAESSILSTDSYSKLLSRKHALRCTDFNFLASSNYDLIRFCFQPLGLSPTEAVCVLWHALSANSGVIGMYLTRFFNNFDHDLRHWPEMIEPADTRDEVREWMQYLSDRFTITEEDEDDADNLEETA